MPFITMIKRIHKQLLSSRSGITIIEVIISVSILAVGILGLLQAFPRGISTSKDVELATVADQLGQAKIEELMAADYNALTPGTLENQARVESDPTNPFYQFKRTSTVELIDAAFASSGADIGLKKITVTVFWPSILGGTDHSVRLIHLKAKR